MLVLIDKLLNLRNNIVQGASNCLLNEVLTGLAF